GTDSFATHQFLFHANDRHSALVAHLLDAGALVHLSDITALYTAPQDREGSHPIDTITAHDDLSQYEFGDKVVNSVGTGGAATKATAGRLAQDNGIGALVTSADNIGAALSGESVGTWLAPAPSAEPRTDVLSVIMHDEERSEARRGGKG